MKDQELRLALVLNGGVSLAVWMGGVLHELDLLRRASAESPSQAPSYDNQVFERWRDLSGDRRITVDVIAGSSAGGLNGAMLATAIAGGGTLDPGGVGGRPWLRKQWEELGAMVTGRLLPRAGTDAKSLLDGDYFSRQLENVLRVLAAVNGNGSTDSDGSQVTLFITATGLGKHAYTARDAALTEFAVADHRFLYRFSNPSRSSAGNDFSDVTCLTEACRATASLPGAFAPVDETEPLAKSRVRPAWGAGPTALIDGGVIDNAPFGPVLDEIVRRPIDGPFDRYVLYLVPSPGGAAPDQTGPDAEPESEPESEPGLLDAVMAAFRYPQEADFRDDIEDLERLLAEADSSWSDAQLLFNRCAGDHEEAMRVQQAATLLVPAYARARAAGGVWDALTSARKGRTTSLEPAQALTEDDITTILGEHPLWVCDPASVTALSPKLDGEGATWPWGIAAGERVAQLVVRSFRERPGLTRQQDLLDAIDDALQRIRAIRDQAAERLAGRSIGSDQPPEIGNRDRQTQLEGYVRDINSVLSELDVPATIGAALRRVAEQLPEHELATAMAVEVVSRVTAARMPLQRSAPFKFLRLGPDIALPIFEDRLRDLPAGGMLFGTQLSRLGAFGATEWRAWDWLIGRLHGVAHLGRLLGADDKWISQTQQAVLRAEGYDSDHLEAKIEQLGRLHHAADDQWKALPIVAAELRRTGDGEQALPGLINRVLDIAPMVTPSGDWLRTVLASELGNRDRGQSSLLRRFARWYTDRARIAVWDLIQGSRDRAKAKPPFLLSWWLVLICLLLTATMVTVAVLTGKWLLPLGIGTGATAVAAIGGIVVRLWLESKRAELHRNVSRRFDSN
jgi:predicted acylesterase/phospholipase RssA